MNESENLAPEWTPAPLRERAVRWAEEQALKYRREQAREQIPLAFRLADILRTAGEVPKVWADPSKHPETWDAHAIMLSQWHRISLERAAMHLEACVCPRPAAGRGRPRGFNVANWRIASAYSDLTGGQWGMSRKAAISVIVEGFAVSQPTVLKAIKK